MGAYAPPLRHPVLTLSFASHPNPPYRSATSINFFWGESPLITTVLLMRTTDANMSSRLLEKQRSLRVGLHDY